MGLIHKIMARFVQYTPTQSYIGAINKYENWINSNDDSSTICFVNDKQCTKSDNNNIAIRSHLISKSANLKPISKNGKVKIVKINHKNPYFRKLTDSAIKSTTTFPGFCKYHDKKLFEPIEGERILNYTNEHFLLLCLRVAVQRRYTAKKEQLKANKNLHHFNEKIITQMLKETAQHSFKHDCIQHQLKPNRLRYLKYLFKTSLSFYFENIRIKKIEKENYTAFNKLSNLLLEAVQIRKHSIVKFNHYSITTNKIAFSSVYFIPSHRKELFIFLFVLPNNMGSDILIGCLDEHYKLLQEDVCVKKCFDGDLEQIQKLIMLEKEEIISNGNAFDDYDYLEMCLSEDNPTFDIFPPNILK